MGISQKNWSSMKQNWSDTGATYCHSRCHRSSACPWAQDSNSEYLCFVYWHHHCKKSAYTSEPSAATTTSMLTCQTEHQEGSLCLWIPSMGSGCARGELGGYSSLLHWGIQKLSLKPWPPQTLTVQVARDTHSFGLAELTELHRDFVAISLLVK